MLLGRREKILLSGERLKRMEGLVGPDLVPPFCFCQVSGALVVLEGILAHEQNRSQLEISQSSDCVAQVQDEEVDKEVRATDSENAKSELLGMGGHVDRVADVDV